MYEARIITGTLYMPKATSLHWIYNDLRLFTAVVGLEGFLEDEERTF